MLVRILFSFSVLLILLSCGSSKTIAPTAAELEEFNQLIEGKNFVIQVDVARPLATGTVSAIANSGLLPPGSNVSRIDVAGMSSYLKVHGDSVSAHLPYYGEQQLPSTYDPNRMGVRFNGVPKKFEISQNTKSEGYKLQFTIANRIESFDVTAQLFANRSSSININSTHRTPIWYSGDLAANTEEEAK